VHPGSIFSVLGLALPIAVFYYLSTARSRDPEQFYSAYRFVLTIALIGVVLLLIPEIRRYADLVITTTRHSAITATPQRKLSAADLQVAFINAHQFAPNSGLQCRPAVRDWDYVCSYLPTPVQSTTRLEFGVTVDSKRWLSVSAKVPAGCVLPSHK
jgi:hypothetical protein